MYELLKTPGKKRDAPKKTRAATAAIAKLKTINDMAFEVCRSSQAEYVMILHDQVRFP